MSGDGADVTPVDLQNEQLLFPEHRFWEHVKENVQYVKRRGNEASHQGVVGDKGSEEDLKLRFLPVLALNEVFIGESLSARLDNSVQLIRLLQDCYYVITHFNHLHLFGFND